MMKLEEALQLTALGALGMTGPRCGPAPSQTSAQMSPQQELSLTPQLKIALGATLHHLTWLVSTALITIQYYLTYICIDLLPAPASQRMEAF